MCHLYIFSTKKDSNGNDGNDDDGNSSDDDDDETFLERENRRLANNNVRQKEAIAQLEKENFVIKQTAELEYRLLHTSLEQAATNAKLLKAEKESLKQNARAALISALRDIRKPLNGIVVSLQLIFSDSLKSSGLEDELRRIAECAHHQRVLIKSAIDLDTFITGNLKIKDQAFNPAKICCDAVAMQAENVKNGVDVVLTSTLQDEVFIGSPSPLNLVLMNLLSRAAMSVRAGTIELRADVVLENKTHQFLRFAVRDPGNEVPAEVQDIFFGSPGQLRNETEQIKSFGFGTFAAHQFVKRISRMRGMLLLKSPIFTKNGEEVKGEGGGGVKGRHYDRVGGGGGSELSFSIRVGKIGSKRKPVGNTSSSENEKGVEETEGQTEEKEEEEKEEEAMFANWEEYSAREWESIWKGGKSGTHNSIWRSAKIQPNK